MSNIIGFIDEVLLIERLRTIESALQSLSSKSWWWDFTVPLMTAGVVAVIASLITYVLTKRIQFASDQLSKQRHIEDQKIKRENEKLQAINELLLLANTCYTTLDTVRGNYSSELSVNLKSRIFEVPSIDAVPLSEVELKLLSRLFFLTPVESASFPKWSQVTRIEMLLTNYNGLMNLWLRRNAMIEGFFDELDQLEGKPQRREDVFNLFPINKFMKLFQLTERCVSLTKQLMDDFNDLITNFEDAFKGKLDKTLPRDLLHSTFVVTRETIELRNIAYENEALADFSVIKAYCGGDEELYKARIRGLIARGDLHAYDIE